MLVLWLLLLLQISQVLVSEAPFGDAGCLKKSTKKRKRESKSPQANKKLAKTVSEKPEDHNPTLIYQDSVSLLEKDAHEMLHALLEKIAHDQNLLPRGEHSHTSELLWDLEKNIVANTDRIVKSLTYSRNINVDLPGQCNKGDLLILSYESDRAPLSFHINQQRYFILGGVVKVSDEASRPLYCMNFTVDSTGILCDRYDTIPFDEMYHSSAADVYPGREPILPSCVKSSEDASHTLHYKYVIYQNIGFPETPYPVQSLDLRLEYRTKSRLKKELHIGALLNDTFDQGNNLILFMQLWKTLKSNNVFETNKELCPLNDKLEALMKGTIEKQELLKEACEYIQRHSSDTDAVNDEYHDQNPYRFFQALMKQASEIETSFVAELDDLLRPKNPINHTICNTLSVEAVFYRDDNYQQERFPYQIIVPCNDRSAVFRLVATITSGGLLIVYGTDYNVSRDERIFKIATYDTTHSVKIRNFPFKNTEDLSLFPRKGLFIYQHFEENLRFKTIKPLLSAP